MLSGGHGTLLRNPGLVGGFLDAQGRAILHGRLAVDPARASFEGFVTGGRTYVYFGPVLSILRLPVLLATDRFDGRLTQLSMTLGFCMLLAGGAALHWRVRTFMRPGAVVGRADAAAAFLVQLTLGAGAIPLFLASRAIAYHESELWGAALAVAALAAVLGCLERPSSRQVALAWLLTMLAINTRFTVGLAPVAALAVLAGGTAARIAAQHLRRPAGRAPERFAAALANLGPASFPGGRGRVLVALALAALVPLATYAAISEAKFGQPFGLPLARQVSARGDPGRQATLAANGGSLFGASFVPTTVLQAVRPDAVGGARAFPFVSLPSHQPTVVGRVRFDTLEESLSAPTSMPLFCLLTLVGIVAIVRERRWRPLIGVLAASAAGFVPTLTIAYVATRYLADFVPFLLLGSLVGLQAVVAKAGGASAGVRRCLAAGAALLLLVGVVVNGSAGLITQRLLAGESPVADRIAFIRTQDDVDRLLRRRPHGVQSGGELPVRSTGPVGNLFILDRCDGLYAVGLAGSWVMIERTARSGAHPLAVSLPSSTGGRAEPLMTVGQGENRVTATVRVASGRAAFGLRVGRGKQASGPSIALPTGRAVRVVLSIDPFFARYLGSIEVKGRYAVSAVVPYDRRAPVQLGRDPSDPAAPRFRGSVRLLPAPTPLCRSLLRRGALDGPPD